MNIRAYDDKDWPAWLRMSLALFANYPDQDLVPGMREFRARDDAEVFIAEDKDGSVVGFVEVGTRPYADGCDTAPVGYIEAWYVDPHVRREGYGRALLAAAEDWARERGYYEMASDAQLGNDVSHTGHLRSGYEEVDRVVQYRKPLRPI
jgi:aminoglycoside 6'-N-acetyltransferase I